MQKNAKKKQLKIEIKILDKNLTACLMSRPAKTRILNPAIVLQGSRCLQIGLHSSKIREAADCTQTLLSDRAQSLRGGIRDLTFEGENEHQRALEKFEEKIQRKKRMVERKRKSDQDVDHLFRTESLLFLLFRS